jgi:hypothetical protein
LLTLNYRETRILKRQDFEAKGARLPNGAILAISQSGVPGDLIVTGAVIDDESEYASNILLVDPSSMISSTLAGVHFGRGAAFFSPLVLANVSSTAAEAEVFVNEPMSSAARRQIETVRLAPGEVRELDVAGLQAEESSSQSDSSLDIS